MTIENNLNSLNRTISYFNKVENNFCKCEIVIRKNNCLNNSRNNSIIQVYPERISKTKNFCIRIKTYLKAKTLL